jgi:hypothetical protein
MRLHGRLVPAEHLTSNERYAMFGLMQRHYDNVVRSSFDADLSEKEWVIQLWRGPDELCGFSTQMILDVRVNSRSIKALFSGDTIIDRQYWGDTALMQIGGELAVSLIDKWPECELYWFLISQGYKTYRFLPVFFREFYPRHSVPTPTDAREIIDALATLKYPDRYDAETGIVRSVASQYRLREGVAEVSPERLSDPHVRYFVARNPLHYAGDELCCLARLTRDNFTSAANRLINRQT